jgi:YesN/AraC family two-component response regulator
VAYALSFDNHSYFNRLFKATTGLTPQEYRDSHNTLSKS